MNIYIADKKYEFENNKESIRKINDLIDGLINFKKYNFSHINIDGVDVYGDVESYIEEKLETIEDINIITMDIKEFIQELINTSIDYMDRAIPLVENLSDKFYSEPNADDWSEIRKLLDGLSWILNGFQTIDSIEKLSDMVRDYEIWKAYSVEVNRLNNIILELSQAIESSDTVLIADLLSYEIVPIFKEMLNDLNYLC